jgi:DNA-binding beta-propeller fold protein YncE
MIQRILPILCCLCILMVSCKHDAIKPYEGDSGNFPPEVAKIIVNKCATAGCHNAASYENSGGLLLDSWEHLFDGGDNGAVVVPYSTEYSSLLYFINTDSAEGIVLAPTMPKDMPSLSKEEYNTIRNWIAGGAPDNKGNIPFASDADTRQKIYMTMQACDKVAVIDAKKNVVMRYISVGTSATTEVPHCLRVSPDGQYAFVSFTAGNTMQKISTTTDQVVADIPLPMGGSYNVFLISPDGTKVIVSDWRSSGQLVYINLLTMKQKIFNGQYAYPHGVASNPSFDTFYVLAQYGNAMYKFDYDGFMNKTLSIDGTPPSVTTDTNANSRNPHEIVMTPDYSKYLITCEKSNEVRIMSRANDSCIVAIPVGAKPQEIAISHKHPLAFITCMEDEPTTIGSVTFRGSVYVINYQTNQLITAIKGKFSSPHAIAVDDKNNTFYFADRNVNPNGPAPHHTTNCLGKNGAYHVYDMTTLQPADTRKFEVLPDPYSADSRFK